jgi:hypothetical protein
VSKDDNDWKDTIAATGFSADLPKLWNYEIVTTSLGSTSTDPDVLSYWGKDGDAGRSIEEYIVYYAVNTDIANYPGNLPQINPEKTDIYVPETSPWNRNRPNKTDKGSVLWSVTFEKYNKADSSKNIYIMRAPEVEV